MGRLRMDKKGESELSTSVVISAFDHGSTMSSCLTPLFSCHPHHYGCIPINCEANKSFLHEVAFVRVMCKVTKSECLFLDGEKHSPFWEQSSRE